MSQLYILSKPARFFKNETIPGKCRMHREIKLPSWGLYLEIFFSLQSTNLTNRLNFGNNLREEEKELPFFAYS